MFEEIVSEIPYDKSKINKLGRFLKRVRKEKSVRIFGLVFILLALFVQYFAFINPPAPTIAGSSNDLINGGFKNASEAANYCENNTQDYKSILNYYGITCTMVAKAKKVTLNSRDYNQDLWSMGRNDVGSLAGETPSPAINGQTYYIRYLWAWDKPKTTSNYYALDVSHGSQKMFLLFTCGNLTTVGFPGPVKEVPKLTALKTTVPNTPKANSQVKPGTKISFRIFLNNSGSAANQVKITDINSTYLKYINQNSNSANNFNYDSSNNLALWTFNKINAGTNGYYVDVNYQVQNNVPDGSKICNYATISGEVLNSFNTNKVCFTASNSAPTPPPTPSTCPYDSSINLNDPRCVPCPNNQNLIASSPQCAPCQTPIGNSGSYTCIVYNKTVTNVTKNILDANSTTASAGDVIKYTLTAKNSGNSDVSGFIFQDNLSYVLDYSSIVESSNYSIKNNSVVFKPTTLKANETKSVSFEVKILNPIPQTPQSPTDPFLYNLTMTNTYGNTTQIKLPAPPVKKVESTASKLPNTGPGSSLTLIGIVAFLSGYFFYRSRLLAIESEIEIRDSTSRSI